MKKIAVIVLHYKNIQDTIACIQSVQTQSIRSSWKIETIVVNNDKDEEVKSNLGKKNRDHIQYIHNKKNLGFAKGINRGIKHAMRDRNIQYILLLNNDTILPFQFINKMLKTHSDISSPVIKFQSINGSWVYDFGGIINWWTGRTKHVEKKTLRPVQRDSVQANKTKLFTYNRKDVDYVSGCCMLVKRKVFEKIGLFDEQFYFYFEDVDFCVRARKAGFCIYMNKDVSIYHALSASVGRWSNQAIRYNLESNARFIIKHLGVRIPIGLFYLLLLSIKIAINKMRGI